MIASPSVPTSKIYYCYIQPNVHKLVKPELLLFKDNDSNINIFRLMTSKKGFRLAINLIIESKNRQFFKVKLWKHNCLSENIAIFHSNDDINKKKVFIWWLLHANIFFLSQTCQDDLCNHYWQTIKFNFNLKTYSQP